MAHLSKMASESSDGSLEPPSSPAADIQEELNISANYALSLFFLKIILDE